MKIGIVDVDGHTEIKKWGSSFPNLVCMKIAGYHKAKGDKVEWAQRGVHYDIIYASKVFTFKPDIDFSEYTADVIIKGGTGYDIHSRLPPEIDSAIPDYSMYEFIDNRTAYGFLTRGCPNKCAWCVVPKKEGAVKPYMDVDDVAIIDNGKRRDHLVLMDNNILASSYGIEQIEKIIHRGYWVDFNQAMDARLVTPDIAKILAKVKWWPYVRFGCDTKAQIDPCQRATDLMRSYGYRGDFFFYCLLTNNIEECLSRVNHWRNNLIAKIRTYPHVQPYLDFENPNFTPPKWQKDMARWCGIKSILKRTIFEDYEPRKGFKCQMYFDRPELQKCTTTDEISSILNPLRDKRHPEQLLIDFGFV